MLHTAKGRYPRPLFPFLAALMPALVLGGTPLELDRGSAPYHPRQPQVAVDARGAIHVVYGIGDQIRYRRSDDFGKRFSDPVNLPSVHTLSLGMRRGPRVAVSDDSICVSAIGGKQGKGRDGDVLVTRSVDGGTTWTDPVRVNDVPDSAREGLHAMASGKNGFFICVWLDLRNRKTEIMASISTDGGRNWSKNTLVYRSPDGSVCECCHPSVTIDPSSHIHVQWRNSLDGARDIYLASSTDGGKTFGKATKLGMGSWSLDACPMDGGAVATAGKTIVSAWRREKTVYLSTAEQPEERSLGTGEQPWIAGTKAGPYVVWLKKRGDVAYLLSPNAKSPIELASHAFDPVIAAGPGGRSPVVAAWETHHGDNYTIQCKVINEH
jgi:hypothetical protein